MASGEGGFLRTDVAGFDGLLEKGIPAGSSVLLVGGPGTGKTVFGLELVNNFCRQGKKCLYMSFEESEERLLSHMRDFGWDGQSFVGSGQLIVKRFNAFDVGTQVEGMIEQARGKMLIDFEPSISSRLSPETRFDVIVVDSVSAISSIFQGKQEAYRAYLHQLYRLLEKTGATSFIISETSQVESAETGVTPEYFLSDGVILFYNVRQGNQRRRALEILKMRSSGHRESLALFKILPDAGITVYPDAEFFGKEAEQRAGH